MSKDVVLSWSSGKDSLLSLNAALNQGFQVKKLVTLLKDDDRVSVHGVRSELLRSQSESLGIPLLEIHQKKGESYEDVVGNALTNIKQNDGIDTIVYGDLYLSDIKAWRKKFHDTLGMTCVYPIWKRDTNELAHEFIELGFKAVLTCVNTKMLPLEFAGRDYDQALLDDLPKDVDPCGENGEFHTFVYGGPLFSKPIEFKRSTPTLREFNDPGHSFRFGFCDLSP